MASIRPNLVKNSKSWCNINDPFELGIYTYIKADSMFLFLTFFGCLGHSRTNIVISLLKVGVVIFSTPTNSGIKVIETGESALFGLHHRKINLLFCYLTAWPSSSYRTTGNQPTQTDARLDIEGTGKPLSFKTCFFLILRANHLLHI